jgi:FkbM family methyltransferase
VLSTRLIQLLKRIPILGSALRWYIDWYREGSVVTIRAGYAKGMRWERHRRYLVNGYWLGQYELPVQAALSRELRPGSLVFDVGANAGFFTLLAASTIGPAGKCVAFDPDPENIASIRRQCSLNGFAWVLAIDAAISDVVGKARLARIHPGAATGHLGGAGTGEQSLDVVTTTLDAAALTYGTPDFVKMDIEGYEGRALSGAATLLAKRSTTWLIEVHGPAAGVEVSAVFANAGYELRSLTGEFIVEGATLPRHILVRPL